ncbi:hypothetical protein Syun_014981 [Stephania yunnanensis]|uniref:Uncharacterized protein n=1 Tax=Stephania yunnanensis TaxID=152371 RepID=A0AAP0JKB8_9MAGN
MLLNAASTRYSLVKGERIVRFVLTAQLRALQPRFGFILCKEAGGVVFTWAIWDFKNKLKQA